MSRSSLGGSLGVIIGNVAAAASLSA